MPLSKHRSATDIRDTEFIATAIYTLVWAYTSLNTHLCHKEKQLFLSPFLTLRATQFFQFVNHSLKLFKADSLGPGAECICNVLHHHAQERTHEPWLLLSQSKFLVGQSPFAKWNEPHLSFAFKVLISVTLTFSGITVMINSFTFLDHSF